jgi:hypothetical protein
MVGSMGQVGSAGETVENISVFSRIVAPYLDPPDDDLLPEP